jgi:O-antigen/teichoic acid export membrane protein
MRLAYRKHCAPPPAAESFKPEPAERKRLIRYGIFNNFNEAGVFLLYTKADNLFIAAFINPVAVGIYAFYTRLNEMAASLLPVKLFDNVVQPLLFATPAAEADRRMPQYFSLLLNMNLLLQLPVLAFSVSYHAEIVQVIFGGKFIEDSWLLPLVVGFSTINVIADPATLIAQYEEKAGIILLSKVFVLYNIAAMLVLLPLFGIYGAAAASGSAQAMKNLFIWWHVRRRAVWTNAGSVLTSGAILWGGSIALCHLLKKTVGGPALMQLFIGAVIFGVALLVYLRSPAISASDRAILASVLRGKEGSILRRLGLLLPAESKHA